MIMQVSTYDFHQPVLLKEVIEALRICAKGIYIDCTFGRGGHSRQILNKLGPDGRIFAIDQDSQAVAYGKKLFTEESRITIEHQNFSLISQIAEKHHLNGKVNGILFDLGVSSPQLDSPERGFSFMRDGPLDMRMNIDQGIPAATWLQQVSAHELESVIRIYGQERHAKKITTAILKQQKISPLSTTMQLAKVVQQAIGQSREWKHPATRTFQAIRVFINKELEALEEALDSCVELLARSGRLLVITFHSIEDQLVKNLFRKYSRSNLPRKLPLTNQSTLQLKKICKPIKPSEEEIAENSRARRAKLHVMERGAC